MSRIVGLGLVDFFILLGMIRVRGSGDAVRFKRVSSLRSLFTWSASIPALLAAVVALCCTGPISANAQSMQDVDAGVASRLRQLEILKGNIHRWGCDKPQYATSVASCRQLNAQAASLAASIDGLRASESELSTEPAADTSEAESDAATKPPRLKVLTFRSRTNPAAHYRTFCVKLCDGSSVPIGYSTRPGGFLADDERCESSCPLSPSKLFYAPTDKGLEQSVALDGQRYSRLPNAFRYRTEFVKDCRCKPEPWSQEAKVEYERRAVVAAQSSGEGVVGAGITESAKIAAGGDIEVAEETEATENRPSADRSKGWDRDRYSNADSIDGTGSYRGYDTRSAYPGYTTRNNYYAKGGYDPRSAYVQPQPQRRRGFFLFGSR
jgi:uncharacterized protein DUF2865